MIEQGGSNPRSTPSDNRPTARSLLWCKQIQKIPIASICIQILKPCQQNMIIQLFTFIYLIDPLYESVLRRRRKVVFAIFHPRFLPVCCVSKMWRESAVLSDIGTYSSSFKPYSPPPNSKRDAGSISKSLKSSKSSMMVAFCSSFFS